MIQTVPVGNPGNPGEWSGESLGGYGPVGRICGAVNYEYNIGKFEVTAWEYCEFLNAVAKTDTYGLYNPQMADTTNTLGCNIQRTGSRLNPGSYAYSVASDWADRPVNLVSWGDAARFCNWLTNGQPTGPQDLTTTEDGSYYLNGATSDAALLAVTRKANAEWVIPTEDEWYKAAYYDPNKLGGAGYWDYPTGTDTVPNNGNPGGDTGNSANFRDGDCAMTWPYFTSEVDAFANSKSPYGTLDQGGNVWEWNESLFGDIGNNRGRRGGSLGSYAGDLQAAYRDSADPTYEAGDIGFRVAEVPEPATLTLLALGGVAVARQRRRR